MCCRKAKMRLTLKFIMKEYKGLKARPLSMLEDSEDLAVKTVQPAIKVDMKWKDVDVVDQPKECLNDWANSN